jgi:hypothetical protein
LGVKRVRDLSWTYDGSFQRFYAIDVSGIKPNSSTSATSNIYCSKLLSGSLVDTLSSSATNQVIAGYSTYVYVKDTSCSNTTDFVNKYGNYLIYYETNTEVADIIDTLPIESGGTFTANWFSWVENQLVTNGDFSNGTTGWRTYGTSGTISVSNNVLTNTAIANTLGNLQLIATSTYNPNKVVGHKYLVSFEIKSSKSVSNIGIYFGEYFLRDKTISANSKTKIIVIGTATNTSNVFGVGPYSDDSNIVEGDTMEYSNVMIIDLNVGFPNGDIPTSINDPRIQEIIRLGYIPTNTTGTYKHIDTKVLPNVDTKIKGK